MPPIETRDGAYALVGIIGQTRSIDSMARPSERTPVDVLLAAAMRRPTPESVRVSLDESTQIGTLIMAAELGIFGNRNLRYTESMPPAGSMRLHAYYIERPREDTLRIGTAVQTVWNEYRQIRTYGPFK